MESLAKAVSGWLKQLDNDRRKVLWRMAHRGPQDTRPVFIFGLQRSGTGMLSMCLGASPDCENLGETDARAFDGNNLRPVREIELLIEQCRFRFLVLKPLKDSHRVRELLALKPGAKAVWAYRGYLDRINSAARKFGRHPLDVFAAFQAGDRTRWQLRGMSGETAALLASINLGELSACDGAALMWWVRNSLYYDQGLEQDARVRLWSYDRFVREPQAELRALLAHLGLDLDPRMLREIHARSVGKDPAPRINERILALCRSLHDRLEATRESAAGSRSPQS